MRAAISRAWIQGPRVVVVKAEIASEKQNEPDAAKQRRRRPIVYRLTGCKLQEGKERVFAPPNMKTMEGEAGMGGLCKGR